MFIFLYVPSVLVWNFLLWMAEGGGGEIRTCTTCCLRDTKAMETVKQSSTNQNSCKCLRKVPTIKWFGKVHGHRVGKIWPISQFPAKHTGVVSGAKIVFAHPGLDRLLGYGHGVIKNEFIIYITCSPQNDCILLFRDPSVTFWPCRIRIYARVVILLVRSVYKQSREKHRHLSLYVQNICGYREKKRTLKYQNKMSFQISLCHRSKIIVNQTEWEFTQRRGEGEGEFLTVPVLLGN